MNNNFLHPCHSPPCVKISSTYQVLLSRKLPLLEMESDGLLMLSQLKAGDLEVKISNEQYLGIFLQPPSITEYKQRLVTWLTESEEDIALRMELTEVQQAAASDEQVETAVLGMGL